MTLRLNRLANGRRERVAMHKSLATVYHVAQRGQMVGRANTDGEYGLEGRFIEAGERLTSVSRLRIHTEGV